VKPWAIINTLLLTLAIALTIYVYSEMLASAEAIRSEFQVNLTNHHMTEQQNWVNFRDAYMEQHGEFHKYLFDRMAPID